jgi:hypothetical protein
MGFSGVNDPDEIENENKFPKLFLLEVKILCGDI